MQKELTLRLRPAERADDLAIKRVIAEQLAISSNSVCGYIPLRQSIDARGKSPNIQLLTRVFIDEPVHPRKLTAFNFPDVSGSKYEVTIIGAGPAGLFAALRCIELGLRPVIFERGKDVRSRRRDLARLNRDGEVNPESNYCFGEGGAGTYSDGKLYTRSSKRGNLDRILQLFVHFGAEENILFESHPHIGTNKLPHIITAMRKRILDCGGKIHFEKKLAELELRDEAIQSISTSTGENHPVKALVLATGHSARDIFELLHKKQVLIEAKPFALGVRVEHPQSLIDAAQYHAPVRDPHLPPAAYGWVHQVNDKGVFSFCMCPGGIIAPAATAPGELVVNGWSPSKRNNPFANSGIVVTVENSDAEEYFKKNKIKVENDDLLLLKFQQAIERSCFEAGGGKLVAPAARLVDFTEGKISSSLPNCSYLPGVRPAELSTVLPSFIYKRLSAAFKMTGQKMKGYFTNEAIVVATESRTSSPVRIPRNAAFVHPQIKNLFPCGEGAGYAGGIVSAAMDGENVVNAIARSFNPSFGNSR
jgi:uncharacterized FAD-dependent dehydrogenase